jgi:hypothetical protein
LKENLKDKTPGLMARSSIRSRFPEAAPSVVALPSGSSASRISKGFNAMTAPQDSKVGLRDWMIFVAFVLVLVVACRVLAPYKAAARDLDGRYANSPLKGWFESLHSSKGPCCSDADGTALADVDWESKDGHYRVRIEGQWWDVPDEAVIKEPNRAARTMVWPVYYRAIGAPLRLDIRCFIPGSMT